MQGLGFPSQGNRAILFNDQFSSIELWTLVSSFTYFVFIVKFSDLFISSWDPEHNLDYHTPSDIHDLSLYNKNTKNRFCQGFPAWHNNNIFNISKQITTLNS